MRCSKMTFETKADALIEVRQQRVQHRFRSKAYGGSNKKNNVKAYPYLCSNCNRWHLTTKNKKQVKKELKTKKRKLSDV